MKKETLKKWRKLWFFSKTARRVWRKEEGSTEKKGNETLNKWRRKLWKKEGNLVYFQKLEGNSEEKKKETFKF